MKIPRKLSIVKFDIDKLPEEYYQTYPFNIHGDLLFLGEIPNMPGHCVIADKAGRTFFGYHTEDFIEVKEKNT